MISRERRGGVEIVRLASPPLNLLSSPMIEALREAFISMADDPPRVAVLFCGGAGADVRELAKLEPGSGRKFIASLHETCAAVRALDAPVIAAFDGVCLGAHLEVAAACDMRIASAASRAGMPEIKVGIPSVIDAWWIMQICGYGAAASLFFDGETIDAGEAHRIGLIDRLVADGTLDDEAIAWAERIARSSPVALAQQKRVLRDWTDETYRTAVAASIDRFAATFSSAEATEAMRAMLEKRAPRF
jgi:enoyl-CoA hydratase/carnithine racemase